MKPTVWQVYNGEIVSLRREGHTLQQIGDHVGVTRERIRQILNEHYGKVEILLLPEIKVAKLIGCTSNRLEQLRDRGLIHPARIGYYYRYSRDDIEMAMLALQRWCKHCGKVLPLKRKTRQYCPECSKEQIRYNYPFRSEDGKRKHSELTRKWLKQHPERWKELSKKALQKYGEKKRREHYALTEYLVLKGSVLPIGSVFKAVGCKNNYLILENGLSIPTFCVRRVR